MQESSNKETQLNSGTGSQTSFLGKCTIGGDYIGVTENGDYRPCGFHEGYRLANVKDKSYGQAWEELQKTDYT